MRASLLLAQLLRRALVHLAQLCVELHQILCGEPGGLVGRAELGKPRVSRLAGALVDQLLHQRLELLEVVVVRAQAREIALALVV